MTGHTNRVIQEVMVEESGLGVKKEIRFSPVGNYRDRVHVNSYRKMHQLISITHTHIDSSYRVLRTPVIYK